MAANDGETRIIVCVMLVPSDVTSVFTSRSSARPEVTNRTFLTFNAASLAARSSAILSSIGTSSGSRLAGVIQVPFTGVTGASSTFRACTARAARDMTMASSAALCAPARVMALVAAKPQQPLTSVRTPRPYDSLSVTPVT